MVSSAAARLELRSRLGRELAVRARFGWFLHVMFLALFASQAHFGKAYRQVIWAYGSAALVSGLLRLWCATHVLKLNDARAKRWLTGLQCLIHFHSICLGAFLSFAFWKSFGNQTLETTLVISVGCFTVLGANMFAVCPTVAAVYVAAQVGPNLVWAAFARDQFGMAPLVVGVIFAVFLAGIVVLQHRYTIGRLDAQMQTEQLRTAKEAAEQASSARARFLANMSHEIRTPINGILGSAQLLRDGPLSAEQQSVLGALLRSAEDLLALVDDILDFSKLRAGKMKIECIPFALDTVVREVVTPMLPAATAKGVDCRVEIAPGVLGSFRGDPLRIRQVLRNLLGNAIKFTPAGAIRVLVESRRSGWLLFSVADTGIGIAADKLPDLFQDFAQGDDSTTRRFGGSGLGLAISKNLADLMGGSLAVESELGKGSRFHFEIPLERCEPAPGVIRALGAALDRAGPHLPAGLRILVAEDNLINCMITEKFLTGAGAIVDRAATGKEAVALFAAHAYDVILMDCHMPEMDGYEAAEAIRSQLPRGPSVPIIAVTASALDENRERCLRAGMTSHVAKPLRREALFDAIQAALGTQSGGASVEPATGLLPVGPH